MAEVDSLIDAAVSRTESLSNEVTTYASQAANAAKDISIQYPPEGGGFMQLAVEPNVYIPTRLDKTEVSTEYDRMYNRFVTLLSNKLNEFMTTYFPVTSDAYDEAQAWLVSTINGGVTGIPTAVESQIWQRARDKILIDNAAAQDAAYTEFASRGMPLPPGALNAKLNDLAVAAHTQAAEVSRETAIKQVEIQIQNVRFAVEQALKMRLGAVSAAIEYIKAYALAMDGSAKYALALPDMQATLINAAANFYNARIHYDEVSAKSAELSLNTAFKTAELMVQQNIGTVTAKVNASVAAANAIAGVAAAASSSLNSLVQSTTQN